jgi:hypothetical protein
VKLNSVTSRCGLPCELATTQVTSISALMQTLPFSVRWV